MQTIWDTNLGDVPISALKLPVQGVRKRIISQLGGWMEQGAYLETPTTPFSATYRIPFKVNTLCRFPQFLFVNGACGGNAAITNAAVNNSIQFFAGIENPGDVSPLNFGPPSANAGTNGESLNYLGIRQSAWSQPDTRSTSLSTSTQYFVRSFVQVASGQKIPSMIFPGDDGLGGGTIATTSTVNGTTVTNCSDQAYPYASTSWGNMATGTGKGAFGPIAIIGEQIVPAPVVGIYGHSIAQGAGSSHNGRGWIGQGLINAGIDFHNNAVAGSGLDQVNLYNAIGYGLSAYMDYVVLQGLTNNMFGGGNTFAQCQSYVLNFCQLVGRPTNKIYLCTELPRTTSTDSWADYAHQGLQAAEPVRLQWNNWIRDRSAWGAMAWLNGQSNGVYQVAGCIDPCPYVERNSDGSKIVLDSNGQQVLGTGGYYVTNGTANAMTGDGIHPTDAAVNLACQAISGSQFPL